MWFDPLSWCTLDAAADASRRPPQHRPPQHRPPRHRLPQNRLSQSRPPQNRLSQNRPPQHRLPAPGAAAAARFTLSGRALTLATAGLVLATSVASVTSVAALTGAAWASPHRADSPLTVRPAVGTPATDTATSLSAAIRSAELAAPTAVPSPTAAHTTAGSPRAVVTRRPTTRPTRTQAAVDAAQISSMASNGIPTVALNAYRVAAARMAAAAPGCGIDWAMIAGIGREESDHGRFGRATLRSDGTSFPRTIGPALDGKPWDLIPAPPNGLALDGDARYAHALGPMQFIPSTWAGYGADATGDGKADIFNINDAALGTARYLCAAGGDLRTRAGRTRAVLTYNHSAQYLAQVLALADAYRRGIAVTGLPMGLTTGSLPRVKHRGRVPVANPGSALAGRTSPVDPTRPVASRTPSARPTPAPRATASQTVTGSPGTVSTRTPAASPTPVDHTTAHLTPAPSDGVVQSSSAAVSGGRS